VIVITAARCTGLFYDLCRLVMHADGRHHTGSPSDYYSAAAAAARNGHVTRTGYDATTNRPV